MAPDVPESENAQVYAYLRRTPQQPARGFVFGQILWRAIAIATPVGAAYGAAVAVLVAIEIGGWSAVLGIAIIGLFVGAFVGFLVGVVVGPVSGAVGAFFLVPYRGRGATVMAVRISSFAVVTALPLLLFGADVRGWRSQDWWIVSMPIGATWFLSPWLVRWYVDAMSDSGLA